MQVPDSSQYPCPLGQSKSVEQESPERKKIYICTQELRIIKSNSKYILPTLELLAVAYLITAFLNI